MIRASPYPSFMIWELKISWAEIQSPAKSVPDELPKVCQKYKFNDDNKQLITRTDLRRIYLKECCSKCVSNITSVKNIIRIRKASNKYCACCNDVTQSKKMCWVVPSCQQWLYRVILRLDDILVMLLFRNNASAKLVPCNKNLKNKIK